MGRPHSIGASAAKADRDKSLGGGEQEVADEPHELDILAEFKKREEKMTLELQELHNEMAELKNEN